MLKNIQQNLLKEIKFHPVHYILLAAILFGALFVRVYRTEDLLGFYYDQGRDALVIWRFWHERKLFLVGPVTGLQGIFLGPFYYYLIAPFYLVGEGNPVYPAVFLSFLSTLAVFMLYFLGAKMHSKNAGIIAATIGAFSYYIIKTGRWLSNPSPIFLTSMLLLWCLWKIASEVGSQAKFKNKVDRWWIGVALWVGVSLHFESASAVFYIPLIMIFAVWQRRNFPNIKTVTISVLIFFATFLPQIAFNFRHDNILLDNFRNLFFEERAFKAITAQVLEIRGEYFWNTFSAEIFPGWNTYAKLFVILSGIVLFASRKKLKKPILPLFSIFLITPMIGYLFFQGNFGNIYNYYLSGYFFPFILLFAIGLGEIWNKGNGVLTVLFFFFIFFSLNGPVVKNNLTATSANRPITLEDQLQAVDWLFENAKSYEEYNVDVYVPPVIPYAYDYLLLWQSTERCGNDLCGMVEKQVSTLYTLYEEDPPHPERLKAWLDRQEGVGDVEEEVVFEHITVQRRIRK